MMGRVLTAAAAAVLLAALGAPDAEAAAPRRDGLPRNFDWTVPLLKEHPLAGRIWSFGAKRFVNLDRLAAAIRSADIVLLGEVHDNRDHHRLQAWAVRQRAALSPKPAVVFEHIRSNQQAALTAVNTIAGRGKETMAAQDFFRILEWERSGWPSTEIYELLVDAVLRARLPIVAGDPPQTSVRAVAKQGASVLPADEHTRLDLDRELEPPLREALLDELATNHCGVMPRTAFANMATAQRYRDAHQAAALAQALGANGAAILIAGNGHIRADRGVPWHLARMAPGRSVVTVMLLEVEAGKRDAAAYLPVVPGERAAADFVIFTPRAERPDPCEAMRRRSSEQK
jgi:uncharacterized iron-regulated protein